MAEFTFAAGLAFAVLGIAAGLMGAFFGVGGGWIVTPLLLLAGLGASTAAGTSMTFLLVTGIFGAVRHARAGSTDIRLGAVLATSMVIGVEGGRRVLAVLDGAGGGETAIHWIFVVFLSILGFSMLRKARSATAGRASVLPLRDPPRRRGPVLACRCAAAPVPLVLIFGVGGAAGLLSGILGVGGGFLLVPAMIHLMGIEDRSAVATSLVGVAAAGAWGSMVYGAGGHINAPVAVCLALGAMAGVPAGVRACRRVDARRFRGFFGSMLLSAAVASAAAAAGWPRVSRTILILAAMALLTSIMVSDFKSGGDKRERKGAS